jgi:hypothetical protein
MANTFRFVAVVAVASTAAVHSEMCGVGAARLAAACAGTGGYADEDASLLIGCDGAITCAASPCECADTDYLNGGPCCPDVKTYITMSTLQTYIFQESWFPKTMSTCDGAAWAGTLAACDESAGTCAGATPNFPDGTCNGVASSGTQAECEEAAGTCAGADPAVPGTTTKAQCDDAAVTAGTFTTSATYVSTPTTKAQCDGAAVTAGTFTTSATYVGPYSFDPTPISNMLTSWGDVVASDNCAMDIRGLYSPIATNETFALLVAQMGVLQFDYAYALDADHNEAPVTEDDQVAALQVFDNLCNTVLVRRVTSDLVFTNFTSSAQAQCMDINGVETHWCLPTSCIKKADLPYYPSGIKGIEDGDNYVLPKLLGCNPEMDDIANAVATVLGGNVATSTFTTAGDNTAFLSAMSKSCSIEQCSTPDRQIVVIVFFAVIGLLCLTTLRSFCKARVCSDCSKKNNYGNISDPVLGDGSEGASEAVGGEGASEVVGP